MPGTPDGAHDAGALVQGDGIDWCGSGYRDGVAQQWADEPGLWEVTVVTVGGIDTYYDYDEQRWKYRRLGGGPVRDDPPHPEPNSPEPKDVKGEAPPAPPHRGRPAKRRTSKAL